MTFGVTLFGELHFRDAATATAAHAAMMQGREDNWMLKDGARVEGATIRFEFDNALPVSKAADWVDSTEFGLEQALVTATTGSVVFRDESGFTRTATALGRFFWQERWAQRQTGFDQGKPNELLVAHVDRLAPPGTKLRILVPLAGKASDLWWLAERGHEVVGVEFVIQAIDAFFGEKDLDCWQHASDLGRDKAFTAHGVTMVCGDFFTMKPDLLGRFDAVYDRAALIALEPSTRSDYVDKCRALLKSDGRTLLVSVAYDQSKASGPPWSIDEPTVRALYAERSIEVLEKRTASANPRLTAAGIPSLDETAYLIA